MRFSKGDGFQSFRMLLAFVTLNRKLAVCHQTGYMKRFEIGGYTPEPFLNDGIYKPSAHVITLERRRGSLSSRYLQIIREDNSTDGVYGTSELSYSGEGAVLLTNISFGSQTFQAVIDTGSGDTWLAESGFQCVNRTNSSPIEQKYCEFGNTYTRSSNFEPISDQHFNVTYADGEVLNGVLGYEAVTLAGIQITRQEVGVVNYASWNGDGTSSGIIGFGFPALTTAYAGTNTSKDNIGMHILHSPILMTMYREGKVAPLFSLAITRGSSAGLLAIGGLPPIRHSPNFASAAFQVFTIKGIDATLEDKPQYTFYSIIIQGFTYQTIHETYYSPCTWANPLRAPSKPSDVQVIIDSGSTLLHVPSSTSRAANLLFSPPATFDEETGKYFVDCAATPPTFGIKIDGQTFHIDARDLVWPTGDGRCMSGIQDGGGGPYVLGDVFLKNVLAVFDIGKSAMRFATREKY